MFRKLILPILLASALLLGACAQATPTPELSTATAVPTLAPTVAPSPTPIILTDSAGREVTLAAPAQHIVTLAPSTTEILFGSCLASSHIWRLSRVWTTKSHIW